MRSENSRWVTSAQSFLWVLLALTLVRGVVYAVLNPPFGSPDERDHFQYVAHLATGGASGPRGAEANQPVTYYALMVPAYWATSGHSAAVQLLAIRLASIPLLLGTVIFAWLAAHKMAPGRPAVPIVATAMVALHPQNTVIGVSANNDSLANFAAAVLTYLVVTLLAGGKTHSWVLPLTGLAIAGALMTKGQILSMAALSSVVLLVSVAHTAFRTRSWWLLLCPALALGLASLVFGTREGAYLAKRVQDHISILAQGMKALDAARQAGLREPLSYLLPSFWSAFLGESVRPSGGWYFLPLAAVVVAPAGYVARLAKSSRGGPAIAPRAVALRAVLVSMIVAQALVVYLRYLQTFFVAPNWAWTLQVFQGRFLLVILVPLALLAAEGWSMLETKHRRIPLPVLAVGMFALFDAASLGALIGYYAWPTGN